MRIEDALTVLLLTRAGDLETEQEAHVAQVDGEVRWFTLCRQPP